MDITFQVALLILIAVLGSIVKQISKRKKQPPGPFGLPFFGVKPFLILKLLFPNLFPKIPETKYFMEMKNKYGNIWSIDMGNKQIVVLASIDVVNESIGSNGKLFANRTICGVLKIISENQGIMFANGELWQANRQLAIKALRELGMGKQNLEIQIQEEANELIENIEVNRARNFSSPSSFSKPLSNVISQLVFHTRNKYDDTDLESFVENTKVMFHSNEVHNILELFSNVFSLKVIRRMFPIVDIFMMSLSKCMGFIENKCRSRIKVESEFLNPSCVFDYFWKYRYQDNAETTFDEKFINIHHSMYDIYFAGIDTVVQILGFSFLLLGKYQHVQDDLRNEIQLLVDDHKLINMEMRKNCPKLLSFIDEVQRFCNVGTQIFRGVTTDCYFKSYEIKPTDIILYDLSTIFRDPTLFGNPDVFDPERFLDESRTTYIPNKSLIPFGIGKRICLGESIAMMELFLFLSKMILRFDILLPDQTKDRIDEVLTGTYGIIHAPLDHEIIFKTRHL